MPSSRPRVLLLAAGALTILLITALAAGGATAKNVDGVFADNPDTAIEARGPR